jgi:hypothetical protein
MVTKYFIGIGIALFGAGAACLHAQQQNPTTMQQQMAAADVPQSAANTVDYKTPLKTFQKYLGSLSTPNTKVMSECLTDRAKQAEFEGRALTDQELAALDAQAQQAGHSALRLDSFIFTPDPQKPRITALVSSVKGQTRITEEMALVLVDTAGGWKIDESTATLKARAPEPP